MPLAGLTQLTQLTADKNPLSDYPHVNGGVENIETSFLLPSDKEKIVYGGYVWNKEELISEIKRVYRFDKVDTAIRQVERCYNLSQTLE
jgi:hypothetical protein